MDLSPAPSPFCLPDFMSEMGKVSPWECAGVEGESVQTPERAAHAADSSGCQGNCQDG